MRHPISGDHLQSEYDPRETSCTLPHVRGLVKELGQCKLQPTDGAREYAEDDHNVEEVSTAIMPLEGDAFPKEGGHVVYSTYASHPDGRKGRGGVYSIACSTTRSQR